MTGCRCNFDFLSPIAGSRAQPSAPRAARHDGPANHWGLALVVMLVAGCASPDHRAPVEDRSRPVRGAPDPRLPGAGGPPAAPAAPAAASTAATAPAAEAPRLPPGAENAGKPGYYTVKRGDTLYNIGLENGQGYRDIARWNGLENPNLIEVGQVLRVVPPVAEASQGAVTKPVAPAGRVETKPLPAVGAVATAQPATNGASAPAAAAPAPGPQAIAAAANTAAVAEGQDGVSWSWPASGPVAVGFEENKTKGLAITGKAGDAVLAAADGRVVYAGSGLRGYGNLVIVKHNNVFLSAYAHNQTLLVKEEQIVRRGQKIAEMGSTDAERVQLHFEIRRQGKPVDPARLLPAR
jgi:lipoprotein NlpD